MISVIRVLHVVGSLNAGGIETFLMSVYRQIDRSKVQFDFLVSSDQRFFYSDEIESLGGGIYPVEQSRYHPKATRYRLKQFYLENNTEIVHQHTGGLQTLMPLVAAEDAGVPTRVLHSHCAFVEPNSTKAQLEEVIHKLNTYRTGIATEKFACSADAAAYFGFDRHGGEWRYVPNGIDVGRFSFDMGKRKDARTELGLLDSTFLIGNIGRFSPQKNQVFLLRAFASVAKRCPDSKLLLVGVGPLEGDIHAEAERLGLTDRVIFLKNRSECTCGTMSADHRDGTGAQTDHRRDAQQIRQPDGEEVLAQNQRNDQPQEEDQRFAAAFQHLEVGLKAYRGEEEHHADFL